jgi:hypothetical protein
VTQRAHFIYQHQGLINQDLGLSPIGFIPKTQGDPYGIGFINTLPEKKTLEKAD